MSDDIFEKSRRLQIDLVLLKSAYYLVGRQMKETPSDYASDLIEQLDLTIRNTEAEYKKVFAEIAKIAERNWVE